MLKRTAEAVRHGLTVPEMMRRLVNGPPHFEARPAIYNGRHSAEAVDAYAADHEVDVFTAEEHLLRQDVPELKDINQVSAIVQKQYPGVVQDVGPASNGMAKGLYVRLLSWPDAAKRLEIENFVKAQFPGQHQVACVPGTSMLANICAEVKQDLPTLMKGYTAKSARVTDGGNYNMVTILVDPKFYGTPAANELEGKLHAYLQNKYPGMMVAAEASREAMAA